MAEQAVDDLDGLVEPSDAFAGGRRERDPESLVLRNEPAGAETELEATV